MTWTIERLEALFQNQEDWIVTVEGECISISNNEGVDCFVYSGDKQLIVEAPLFTATQILDINTLNEFILNTHHMLPLTAICKKAIGEESYYMAFGALSSDSKESVVVEEVETLFENVGEFLELYSEHLKKEVA